jgi:predicted Zn-dependent peptidase
LFEKTVLNNGLRLLTVHMPHTHSVSISFFIGVGSRYEAETHAGISHFIEHLCFKGTNRRTSAAEISAAIEGVGGVLNGGTDKEITIYWCKVAQPHFLLALDVLVDMLVNSRFDPPDIERERQVIIEEIHMTKDSPAQEVNLLIDELLWPGHPLGRDTAGSKDSVSGISREMMLSYLEKQYLPTNTVVAIAGNVQHEIALSVLSEAIGNWRSRRHHPNFIPYQEQKNRQLLIQRRDTEQAHLCLALPGLPLLHPKRFVLDLLNVVLGEGMSSRLFTEIRDNRGLAYNIHSYVDHFQDSGSAIVYAGVEPENLRTVIEAILEQMAQLKTETVPETELDKAKELSKGRVLLRMEDSRNVAGWVGGQEILTGQVITIDQVIGIIDAITADQLQELAEEMFVGDRLRLAVVGPISEDEPLEPLLKL